MSEQDGLGQRREKTFGQAGVRGQGLQSREWRLETGTWSPEVRQRQYQVHHGGSQTPGSFASCKPPIPPSGVAPRHLST